MAAEQMTEGDERGAQSLLALAKRVRTLRERRGFTQDEFARRCGISVSFASLLERGERSPSYETLWVLSKALEVPLAELFRDRDGGVEDPSHGRLLEFARRARLSGAQVDRFLAVGHAMFDYAPPSGAGVLERRRGAKSCTVPGCEGWVLAKGLCTKHYHQARRGRH